MGAPNWERNALPMQGEGTCVYQDLIVDGEPTKVTCLSIGNPHCIVFVDSSDDYAVEYIGPIIENHEAFPNRVNAGFAQIISKNEMKLRVWERGCGETLACGTGTCAAVAAANRLSKVGNKVTVHLRGGDLQIEICTNIYMTGPVEKVFEGKMF